MRIMAKVGNVKTEMIDRIDMILANTEKLDTIAAKSADLLDNSSTFKGKAGSLKWAVIRNNFCVLIALGIFLLLVIAAGMYVKLLFLYIFTKIDGSVVVFPVSNDVFPPRVVAVVPNLKLPSKKLKYIFCDKVAQTNKMPLTIATYNVLCDIWDNTLHFPKIRFTKQIQMLKELNADILCLQEVTHNYYFNFLTTTTQSWTKYYYKHVDTRLNDADYLNKQIMGNVILSKYPIINSSNFTWHDDKLDRPAIVAIIQLPHAKLAIINVHLKAQENDAACKTRKLQMQKMYHYAKEQLQQVDEVIILGDLNLHWDAENENIPAESWYDCWQLKGQDKGYTMDCETNGLLKHMYPTWMERLRLDRILWRKKKTDAEYTIWLESIEVFGEKPIFSGLDDITMPNAKLVNCCASDHYGIKATFI